jgi:hypothetical protein
VDLHWTYKDPDPKDLEQGDLLERSDALVRDILEQYHPYYAARQDNRFFAVVTQSCDLVRREGGVCSSRYISLVPVRPLHVVLQMEFGHLLKQVEGAEIPIGSDDTKTVVGSFMERLFKNNETRYFFLRSQPDRKIAEDMCAILRLPVSIKAEHYQRCMDARFLALDSMFQAKLGWLLGQQFSRIGTQDWSETELDARVEETLRGLAFWCRDDTALKTMLGRIQEIRQQTPEQAVTADLMFRIHEEKKSRKDRAIDAVLHACEETQLLRPGRSDEKLALRRRLTSDPVLSGLLPGR